MTALTKLMFADTAILVNKKENLEYYLEILKSELNIIPKKGNTAYKFNKKNVFNSRRSNRIHEPIILAGQEVVKYLMRKLVKFRYNLFFQKQ